MSTGAVVLCKNASTIIAGPKYTAVVTQGCAGMAKGGSGDVLAGCMGGLLAQGYSAFDSACMAAYICGKGRRNGAAKAGAGLHAADGHHRKYCRGNQTALPYGKIKDAMKIKGLLLAGSFL